MPRSAVAHLPQRGEQTGGIESEIGLGDLEGVEHQLAAMEFPAQAGIILGRARGGQLFVAVARAFGRSAAVFQAALGAQIERNGRRQSIPSVALYSQGSSREAEMTPLTPSRLVAR